MTTTNSNQLFQALFRLNRQMHRMAHRGMQGRNELHRGQAYLLKLVSQNDGASQRDLAEQMDVRPSTMTELISKMEAAGMLLRKQDEKDQRVMRIYLTEQGKKFVGQSNDFSDEFADSVFDSLSEEEKAQMLAIVEKLCTDLEAKDTAGLDMFFKDRGGCHGYHHGHHHDFHGKHFMHGDFR